MRSTFSIWTEWNFRKPLSPTEIELVERIAGESFEFVFQRLLADSKIAQDEVAQARIEFRKFVFLVGSTGIPLAMISPVVDEVWHQFILFTKKYAEFCNRTVGYFIDHLPDTDFTPVPVIAGENFRRQYTRYFGDLPAIWLKRMDEATRAYYLADDLIGKPPTAWSGWTSRD